MSEFLYDYQMDAVNRMKNGCILNGGVGSGKSRTGLYYYFKEQGGSIIDQKYIKMKNPKDLYIITTAMKRDLFEWEEELANYTKTLSDKELEIETKKQIVQKNIDEKYEIIAQINTEKANFENLNNYI